MERIALPTFQAHISPVLDACQELMVIDIENGQEIRRITVSLAGMSRLERAETMARHRLDSVICAGISDLMSRRTSIEIRSKAYLKSEDFHKEYFSLMGGFSDVMGIFMRVGQGIPDDELIARIKEKQISIRLEQVKKNSSIGQLRGTENICIIKTNNYFNTPLAIKGPGAGIEVTADGVLRNILECYN